MNMGTGPNRRFAIGGGSKPDPEILLRRRI